MAEETYFEKIRARPYDQAAKRSQETILGSPAWAISPDAAGHVGRGLTNVVKNVAAGPLDAADTAIRKVGGAANAGIDKLTGGGTSGFGGPGGPGMKVFPDLQGERVLPDIQLGEDMALPAGIGRGISTFMTLYGPTASMLAAGGAVTWGGSMAAGAFADMLAFENKTGTLSDVLRSLGLDNEFTRALSGELADDEWQASLRAGLEGAGLGMLGPAYGALKAGLLRWPTMGKAFAAGLASGAVAADEHNAGPGAKGNKSDGSEP